MPAYLVHKNNFNVSFYNTKHYNFIVFVSCSCYSVGELDKYQCAWICPVAAIELALFIVGTLSYLQVGAFANIPPHYNLPLALFILGGMAAATDLIAAIILRGAHGDI